MLIIKTNQPNTLVVTVSQNSELTNPEYLFSFTHIFSKQNITFIPPNISTHKGRYDEFVFVEGIGAGKVPFPYQGQYIYAIYEQTLGSGNLDPTLAYNVVENGDAQVFPASAITMDSQYDIFVSDNEDNANIIFAPDEIVPQPNPTPSVTPSPTATSNQPTPTPSVTPTHTTTPSPTPAPAVLQFLVHRGGSQNSACNGSPNEFVYAADLGLCNPCSIQGINCWACLTTSQQVFSDIGLTTIVQDGYYKNEIALGINATWHIIGGFPQGGGGFMGCP